MGLPDHGHRFLDVVLASDRDVHAALVLCVDKERAFRGVSSDGVLIGNLIEVDREEQVHAVRTRQDLHEERGAVVARQRIGLEPACESLAIVVQNDFSK